MTTRKPSHLVPKLRFPEFEKSPAWVIKPLGSLFVQRQEIGFTDLPLLSLTDREGIIPQEETNRKNNSSADKAKYLRVVPGDIAYNTMRMWEGRSARVGLDGLVSPAYTVCMPLSNTNSNFFSYYFKTESLIGQFRKYSQGLVKDTLNLKYENFSRIPVGFPPLPEQQKIADCLSSLDDLITAEGRKLEALRQHKKGLMQQLFPQEGETTPRLRFPEFEGAGEWEPTRVGDLFANRKIKGETGLPIYSVTMYDGMVRRDSLDRNFYDIEDATGNKKVCKGDIAYNMMRMWQGALGVATEDCLVSPAYVVLAPKENIVPEFFAYLFKIPSSLFVFTSHSRGLTKDRLRLYYEDFAQIHFFCPGENEQKRIVDFVESMDELLAAHSRRISALNEYKKGLLLQLFPALDEVQG
jgi:type I restriction enzyme, S subunit